MAEIDAHVVSSGTKFGIQPSSHGCTTFGIQEQGTTTSKEIDEFSFRKILLSIDRNLVEHDILALKYLCLDKNIGLRHGELEKVNRGLDLLEKLERRGFLSKSKLEVLIELLGLIERFDLQRDVEQCLDLQQKKRGIQEKKISSYRSMILDFASDIGRKELESLKPLLKHYIPARTIERLNEPIKLMIELEKLTVISPQKIEFLFQVADYLEREDLLKKLEEFKVTSGYQEIGTEKGNHISRNSSHTSSGNRINTLDNSFKSLRVDQAPYHHVNRPDHYISHVAESLGGDEWKMLGFALGLSARDTDEVCDAHGMLQKFQEITKEEQQFEKLCSGLRSRLVGRDDIAIMLEKDYKDVCSKQVQNFPVAAVNKQEEKNVVSSINTEESGLMARYKMASMPRGICLIINNMKFMGRLKERRGSEIDEDSLKFLFKYLGFQVIVRRNATSEDMKRQVEDVSRMDHTNYDCFVCCMLSHGDLGTIFSSDEISCKILDFTSPFRPRYCPSLAGKPKLFFLQACQGSRKAEDFEHFQVDSAESGTDNIPDDADFLLGYATAPGNVSFRSRSRGSWYISKLTNALQHYHNTHHILDILTHVNNEVSKAIARESEGTYKQVPAPQFTLRKQLFLTKL
ncbi:caspase-8-like isoform X2 [Anneissia japonica]|nr:caspase-8-like isoform X2 [Anneissia japonica]